MSRDLHFWHKRYTQQARWTLLTRRFIFDVIGARPSHHILEVGCGSGAVLDSLAVDGFTNIIGLDLDFTALKHAGQSHLIKADALKLPLAAGSVDLCLCHFLLLWVADPLQALREMKRAAKPGGWVLVLAEPDYGGRIDYPPELAVLGKAQALALHDQGADAAIGRRLRSLFTACELEQIETGIISAEWRGGFNQEDFEMEWEVMRKDLAESMTPVELESYYKIDLAASQEGTRVLFVPIFYAFGQVPG